MDTATGIQILNKAVCIIYHTNNLRKGMKPTILLPPIFMGVHTFLKGISLKVNVIAWLDLELTYYDIAVQHVDSYTSETPPEVVVTTGYITTACLWNVITITRRVVFVWFGLVWFGFMVHQPLSVIIAKSIFIHSNSSISNNSV